MLPPAIMPCENSDTLDMRYINSNYAPIKHPFDNNFDIEAYNTNWYDDAPPSRAPDFIKDNVIPSVSAVRSVPLSNNYIWTDASVTWNQAPPPELLVKPTAIPPTAPVHLPPVAENKPTQSPTNKASRLGTRF